MSAEESGASPTPPPAEKPSPAAPNPGEAHGDAAPGGPHGPPDGGSDGPDRRQFGEAYAQGRKLTTDGPMAFIREPVVDDMHIGDRNYFYYSSSGGAGAFRAGSVRDDVLDWVRARYVPVPGYRSMLRDLRDRRVLVLRGRPGTGRFTTALRLVDEVVDGKISRLDGQRGLSTLTEADIAQGRGYVVELTRAAATALTELELDRIRDLLEDKQRSAYLVVICPHDELDRLDAGEPGLGDAESVDGGDQWGSLGDYTTVYTPPETRPMLHRHLTEETKNDAIDADFVLALYDDDPRLTAALGPQPRPVETARMAGLLARLGRGEIDVAQVETAGARIVRQQVREWFDELAAAATTKEFRAAAHSIAFRIALAVLDGSPYDMVASAALSLAGRFIELIGKKDEKEQQSLFANDHARMLPASRAHMVDGYVSFGMVAIPTTLVTYADSRFPALLLGHLWHHHHNLRSAVAKWLMEMGADERPMVWVRAAQATGLFCSLAFHDVFTTMILPSIVERDADARQRRRFAAVALDHAARDERINEAVYERLAVWRRQGSDAMRWTTAVAFGYDLGLRRTTLALDELRVLGTPSETWSAMDDITDRSLVRAAASSMANLLAFGAVQPVLQRLSEWTRSHRQSVRELAWQAVVALIDLHGFDLHRLTLTAGRPDLPAGSGRNRWPLLLALVDVEPTLVEPVAGLLRWALRGRRGDIVAQHLFSGWIRAAETDSACLTALSGFLPNIAHNHDDVQRLRHLIARMRRDWADPLDDTMASVLEQAVVQHKEVS